MAFIPPKGIRPEQHSYLECLRENCHCRKGEQMIPRVSQFIRQNALLLLVLALIAGAYFFLRTSPSDIASMEALEDSLRHGQPTLIEFYSNF